MKSTGAFLNLHSFQRISGHLFFLVLIVYSIVYAVERTTYVDSAWIFFQQMNGETFAASWERFPSAIPEVFLYAGVKLHLPINYLVYIFSIGYVLFIYGIWFLCTSIFKNPIAGLTVMLGTFMGIRELFIHTITETHQCIAYGALLYALINYQFNNKRLLKILSVGIVALLTLFSHPFGIFIATFVLIFQIISNKSIRDISTLCLGLMIMIRLIIAIIAPPEIYGQQVADQIAVNGSGSQVFSSHALEFLTLHFSHFYWLPEFMGLLVVIGYAMTKEWLKLTIVAAFAISYLIIALIAFGNGDSSIMMERIFLPTFFMLNLAFADLLFRDNKMPKWIPMVLVLFFIVNGIHYINAGCLMYKKRVSYLDELVQKGIAQGSDKYVLPVTLVDKEKILVPWALGAETLIYSKLKYNKCISITLEPGGCDAQSVRITHDLCLPVSELNIHYFSLSENQYQPIQ